MSFWGATVITSLATVIPVVGKQIVYWLWGGLKKASIYCEIVKKILSNAGNSLFIFYKKVHSYFLSFVFIRIITHSSKSLKNVKIEWTQAKSAGFCDQKENSPLFPSSQRLNTEDLIWLVGFTEGDGCFSVTKNGDSVNYEFSIEVSIRDIQLLYKIKRLLKVGSITTRTRKSNPSNKDLEFARLKISSKPDLINIILPIFSKYEMLTSKKNKFIYFKECLISNVIYFKDLPLYVENKTPIFKDIQALLNVSYFDSWLVGFIEAEGCFSTYLATGETNKTCSFSLSQTHEKQILDAIQKKFKLKSKVNAVVFPNSPNNIAYSINTASSHGVHNIVTFLKKAPVKFQGDKKIQYYQWLHELRSNSRYKSVIVPNFY